MNTVSRVRALVGQERWMQLHQTAVEAAIIARHRIHARPEIGLHLPVTQALVVERLKELGIEYRLGESLSSVTGLIRGGGDGPTILLRADMDALPITERTGLAFSSEIDGASHACGHDIHTASLLGAASVLAAIAEHLGGNVVLMFQPGEEGYFGARAMIEEGVLDSFEGIPPVSSAFALHVNPWYPVGTVRTIPGAILAAADSFSIRFTGVAGHGSAPHAAANPIPALAELVQTIQTGVAREVSSFEPVVVSVTGFVAGALDVRTAIPEIATIVGTIRTLSAGARERVTQALARQADAVALAHGMTALVEIDEGYPVTVNDPLRYGVVDAALSAILGAERVNPLEHALMGSEDFSYVLENVPGVLAFVGTTPQKKLLEGFPPDNHSDTVIYDEGVVEAFISVHVAITETLLGNG